MVISQPANQIVFPLKIALSTAVLQAHLLIGSYALAIPTAFRFTSRFPGVSSASESEKVCRKFHTQISLVF